jgi:hypothetical protein
MATEPLPPVADRRAPERRSSYDPPDVERTDYPRTAAAAAMSFCGGLAILFVFFWALGGINLGNAVAATVAAVVLALIWLAGAMYRRGREEPLVIRRDRERRGF